MTGMCIVNVGIRKRRQSGMVTEVSFGMFVAVKATLNPAILKHDLHDCIAIMFQIPDFLITVAKKAEHANLYTPEK